MLPKINTSNLFSLNDDFYKRNLSFTDKVKGHNETLQRYPKNFFNIRKYQLITAMKHLQDSGFFWLYNSYEINTWNGNKTNEEKDNKKLIFFYGKLIANLSKLSKKLLLDFSWLNNMEEQFKHENKQLQFNITFKTLELLNKKIVFLKKIINNKETNLFAVTDYNIRKKLLMLIFQIEKCLTDNQDRKKINAEGASLDEKKIAELIPFLITAADVKENIKSQIIIFLKKFDEVIMNIENDSQNLVLQYNWKNFFEEYSKTFLSILHNIINVAFKGKNKFLFLFLKRKLYELKNYFFKILLIITKDYLGYCNKSLVFLKNLRSDFTCYFNLMQNEISWKISLYFTNIFNSIVARNELEIYNLTWQLNQAFINNSDILKIYQNPQQILQEIRDNKTTSLNKIINRKLKEINPQLKESDPSYVAIMYLFTFVVLSPLLCHYDPPLIPRMFNTFEEIQLDESEVWSLPRLSVVSQEITNDFNIYLRMTQKKFFPYFDDIYSSEIKMEEINILHNEQINVEQPMANHDINPDELVEFNEEDFKMNEDTDLEVAFARNEQEINGAASKKEIITDDKTGIVIAETKKAPLANSARRPIVKDKKTASNEALFKEDEEQQVLTPLERTAGREMFVATRSGLRAKQSLPPYQTTALVSFDDEELDYEDFFFAEVGDDKVVSALKTKIDAIESNEEIFFEEKGELEMLKLQENGDFKAEDFSYYFREKGNEEFKNEDFDYYLFDEKNEEEKEPLVQSARQQSPAATTSNIKNLAFNVKPIKLLIVVMGVLSGFLPLVILWLYFSKKNNDCRKNKTPSRTPKLVSREKVKLVPKSVTPCENNTDDFDKTEINKLLVVKKQDAGNLKNVL